MTPLAVFAEADFIMCQITALGSTSGMSYLTL